MEWARADVSRFYWDTSRGLLCGTKEFDGAESGARLAAKKRRWKATRERASLGGITESVSCSPLLAGDAAAAAHPARQCSSGDKMLFFTEPPSVAQARPIRRQWLVNSSQSGGKPRRDRDHGAILLMNYLSARNNSVSVFARLRFDFAA